MFTNISQNYQHSLLTSANNNAIIHSEQRKKAESLNAPGSRHYKM